MLHHKQKHDTTSRHKYTDTGHRSVYVCACVRACVCLFVCVCVRARVCVYEYTVTGMHPSFIIEHIFIGFWVVPVTFHYSRTLRTEFPCLIRSQCSTRCDIYNLQLGFVYLSETVPNRQLLMKSRVLRLTFESLHHCRMVDFYKTRISIISTGIMFQSMSKLKIETHRKVRESDNTVLL